MRPSRPYTPTRPFKRWSSAASARQVGVELTPEKLALPGLRFTTAFILSYDDSPLALIAYVDSKGAPVLFCIIANGSIERAGAHGKARGVFAGRLVARRAQFSGPRP